MKLHEITVAFAGALILLCSACGTAAETPKPLTVNEAASTLVALTDQAATQSAHLRTPTSLPPILTPTFSKPVLYINADTHCRTGASANFQPVAALNRGSTVDLVGKDTQQSAWLIKAPNGSGTCWVTAGDGSPSGDYESLPEVTPQPSTQKLPSAPVFIGWNYSCTYSDGVLYKFSVKLSWIDTAHDANGFFVYRKSAQIADVPATTTSIIDTVTVVIGTDLTYSIAAYNDAGISPQQTRTLQKICTQKYNN